MQRMVILKRGERGAAKTIIGGQRKKAARRMRLRNYLITKRCALLTSGAMSSCYRCCTAQFYTSMPIIVSCISTCVPELGPRYWSHFFTKEKDKEECTPAKEWEAKEAAGWARRSGHCHETNDRGRRRSVWRSKGCTSLL
jgi:hypothetical protein